MTERRDLLAIYSEAIAECDPALLVQKAIVTEGAMAHLAETDVDLVAVGKCAARLYRGASTCLRIHRAFVSYPRGYTELDDERAEVHVGSHPDISPASIDAGRALLRFLRNEDRPVLFLISGGASASLEFPLSGVDIDELIEINTQLVRSSLPIESINIVRKHLSAIKGGRLLTALPYGSVTGVLSDVRPGDLAAVGSGPTFLDLSTNDDAAELLESLATPLADSLAERLRNGVLPDSPKNAPEFPAVVLGDNRTLTVTAASIAAASGLQPVVDDRQVDEEIDLAVDRLVAAGRDLPPGSIYVGGGEPVLKVTGDGRGGRCSELAARFALRLLDDPGLRSLVALFGSSDGADGNSGSAGAIVDPSALEAAGTALPARIAAAMADSDTASTLSQLGEAIIMQPTGNNLRDLYLLARR